MDFLEEAKEKYTGHLIATHSLRAKSGDVAVHHTFKNSYRLGEEAVIDCLLLSQCDILIRTSSNLSLWSTYFNPTLPTILLNQRNQLTLEAE